MAGRFEWSDQTKKTLKSQRFMQAEKDRPIHIVEFRPSLPNVVGKMINNHLTTLTSFPHYIQNLVESIFSYRITIQLVTIKLLFLTLSGTLWHHPIEYPLGLHTTTSRGVIIILPNKIQFIFQPATDLSGMNPWRAFAVYQIDVWPNLNAMDFDHPCIRLLRVAFGT